jgi:hypothetical protein
MQMKAHLAALFLFWLDEDFPYRNKTPNYVMIL